jgi:hypothetical protein
MYKCRYKQYMYLFTYTILGLFLFCTKYEGKPIQKYDYQCYQYYSGKDNRPSDDFCEKCLCIDTLKVDKKKF